MSNTTMYSTDNNHELNIPILDKDSVRVIGFSDSSFSNNYELLAKLGTYVSLPLRTAKLPLLILIPTSQNAQCAQH